MSNRDQADEILGKIGESNLTDEEYSLSGITDDSDLQEVYDGLAIVLNERGSEGIAYDKLKAQALIDDITLGEAEEKYLNINLGIVVG